MPAAPLVSAVALVPASVAASPSTPATAAAAHGVAAVGCRSGLLVKTSSWLEKLRRTISGSVHHQGACREDVADTVNARNMRWDNSKADAMDTHLHGRLLSISEMASAALCRAFLCVLCVLGCAVRAVPHQTLHGYQECMYVGPVACMLHAYQSKK